MIKSFLKKQKKPENFEIYTLKNGSKINFRDKF